LNRLVVTLAVIGSMLVTTGGLPAAQPTPAKAGTRLAKPNVLFILADDFRQDCIGAGGNPHIQTPTLDKLSARGFSFTHAYTMGSMVGAVCTPSRTMMLTGRSLFHAPGQDYALWPKAMAAGGYETFHLGKKGNSFGPGMEAFETHLYTGDLGADTNHETASQKSADRLIEFLRGRKIERPFFVYFAPPVPHDPRLAPREFMDLYDPAKIPLPVRFAPVHPFDNGEMTVRDEMLAPHPRTPEIVRRHLADYYACVTCLDFHIGRILATLKELGQLDNTIVIFTGDNGLSLGDHGLLGKQNLYEQGGMHVPLIIAGPEIPHGRTGAFLYLYDLFPTVCDLTDTAIPTQVEGRSQSPVIKGQAARVRDYMFNQYGKVQRSIRDERWKIIRYPQINLTQLFDLQADPNELHNLADEAGNAGKVRDLMALMEKAQKEFDDPCPLTSASPTDPAWSPDKLKTVAPPKSAK
jgi:arylsulfatase A-like enzyme